ncbi:lactonase family protein [Streptomyces cavernae]|uniref:lactonase family protein n=1 Tax=Streptomyces cavernae TaxID=2259034 RepID=UPI000FEC054C|nr:lactonase family protein [Streptomyces cavernae]
MAGAGRRHGRAFIGSFTTAGGLGVLTAALEEGTGALTALGALDGVANPSYLALAGDMLYAVSETDDGAVAAFRVTGDMPEPAGDPVPVDGSDPTHLTVFDGHVLTANYSSGSFSAVPVRPDGGLADKVSGVLAHQGSGPDTARQEAPHAHQVLPDPSGRRLLGVDLGTDSVRVYTLVDGAPVVHRETALRPGSGPRHLAFHPGGERAYVLNELAPTITVCGWDAAEGELRPLAETPVLPGTPDGDAYPSGIVVSPDGRFVWTATRGQDVLSVLSVDGGLTLVATVPCGGAWPRDLALHPSGRFLYAANERSGDVTWFAVDPETGIPRRSGSIAVPAASCVVFG